MRRGSGVAPLVLGFLAPLAAPVAAVAAWNLVAQHSGKCAHVWQESRADGAEIRQWSCNVNKRHLKWLVDDLPNDEVYLTNVHSGK